MAYDWKTSKLVQAKMALNIAKEALSDARVLLDHDKETFELARKTLDVQDEVYFLMHEVHRMLENYKDEKEE